jgi:hypothetical protein
MANPRKSTGKPSRPLESEAVDPGDSCWFGKAEQADHGPGRIARNRTATFRMFDNEQFMNQTLFNRLNTV